VPPIFDGEKEAKLIALACNVRPMIDHGVDLGHAAELRLGDYPHALAADALADDVIVVHASNIPPNAAESHQSPSGCRFTTRILRRLGRSGWLPVEGVDCYLPMRLRIVASIDAHYA
jgi:hypothetical protein